MSIVVTCPKCGTRNRVDEQSTRRPLCGKCRLPLPVYDTRIPIHLGDSNFDSFIRYASKPVLVDFWAQWCGPCRMMAPVIEEFSGMQHSITVAKLNIEKNPLIPARLNIMAIPTLILFDGGAEKKRITSALSLDQLKSELSQWLKYN